MRFAAAGGNGGIGKTTVATSPITAAVHPCKAASGPDSAAESPSASLFLQLRIAQGLLPNRAPLRVDADSCSPGAPVVLEVAALGPGCTVTAAVSRAQTGCLDLVERAGDGIASDTRKLPPRMPGTRKQTPASRNAQCRPQKGCTSHE